MCFLTLAEGDTFDSAKAHFALGVVAKSGRWQVLEELPTLTSGKPDLLDLTDLAIEMGGNLG